MSRRTTRPGEAHRATLERAIGLRFKHLGDFVDELAANLSTGGMFIRTRRPHPVGSVFEFELRLTDDRPPIAGKAQVAWVRRRSDTLDEPVGMGVRFVELEDESRRRIAELVAAHEAAGGQPAGLEPPPGAQTATETDTADTSDRQAPAALTTPPAATPVPAPAPTRQPAPVAGAASARSASRRSRWPWILLTIVLAAALASSFWRRPAPDTTPTADGAPIQRPAAAPPAAVLSADGGVAVEADPIRAVNDWARAWSEQRVDDYLDAYSSRFQPTEGIDRGTWERQRRTRILAPQWIEVGLAFVELEAPSADQGRVRFVQVYKSDSYRDVVRKVLDLEREKEGWKILRETVEP